MTSTLRRARIIGGLMLIAAFGAGVAVGVFAIRRPRGGLHQLTVITTDQMPDELVRLGLSDAQRSTLRPIIHRGAERVMRVIEEFDPRMQAAVDSTDVEVRAVLDPRQLIAFDSARRANGPLLKRERIRRPGPGLPP